MAPDELEILLLDPETEVTAATLAGLWGVTTRSVTDLAKRGIVVRAARGRYRFLASNVNYAAHQREQAAGRAGEDGIDLVEERALLAREQRRGQAIRNAEAERHLVPVADVARRVSRIFAVVRERLLGIPGKLSGDLTPEQVERVDAEVREALEELSADADLAEGRGGADGGAGDGPEDPEAAA